MPPKRKASSSDLTQTPTKRLTRSILCPESAGTTGRVTRSSGKLIDTPSTPIRTPQPTKTYGKNTSARRLVLDVESSKENEGLGQASSRDEVQPEMSDDELDVLSPSKNLAEYLDKQPRQGSLAEASTFTISTTSKKQLETPVHRPAKRGRTVPTPRSETSQSENEIILPRPNGRSRKPTATTPQVEGRKSPMKSQVTTARRTSPRKKPLVVTSGSNVDYTSVRSSRMRGSLSRRGSNPQTRGTQKQTIYGTQDDSSSPSKLRDTTENPSNILSEALIERSPDPDASRSTPRNSLIFSGVVLPSVSTPVKSRLWPKATSTGSAPESLSDESPTTQPLDFTHAVGLRTNSAAGPELSKPTPTPLPPVLKRRALPSPSLPTHAPRVLPNHLHTCLVAQKRAILQAIQQPPEIVNSGDDENEDPSTNKVASKQLTDLLNGTINRGEGNSCLILGPRGSGKSRVGILVSQFLKGWTQHSDRLAMREIARQLSQQTGKSFVEQGTDKLEDVEADGMKDNDLVTPQSLTSSNVTTAAHLPSLISLLPTFNRPTVVILDGFDLFVLHPRQALLYCLLDTAQNCRGTVGTRGLAVIGVTSHNDTIVHLEKRVKSRFSGRMIRTAPPRTLQVWQSITKAILTWKTEEILADPTLEDDSAAEWHGIWTAVVEQFLHDIEVQNILNETFGITRDIRILTRILQAFTFEMLYESFRDQVRASTSAPVQLRGGSIGMVRCSRQVLMIDFENLVAMRAFVPVVAYAQSVAKEFVKYRSVIEREDVKKAVEKMGQVNLKKWLTKATQ
ncbi:hypothetical protein C0993_010282 [Termitomyces sp. T159_Od127]|nr:hypothetical protein C0993_010282 [Termitomyces sp. T159_Od127]